MKRRTRVAAVWFGLVFVLAINYLANALPINGRLTGEISDRFDVVFKPAGFTFAIWGIIYLALLGFALYQSFRVSDERIDQITLPFLASCLGNALWLVLWHYEAILLTVPVMLLLLGSLVALYVRLERGPRVSLGHFWLVRVPFGLYLGWVSVATAANITIALSDAGWTGAPLSPETWAAVIATVVALVGLGVAFRMRDPSIAAVITWALFGLHAAAASLEGPESILLVLTWAAAAATVGIAVWAVAGHVSRRNMSPTTPGS